MPARARRRVRDALRAGRTCLSRGWPHDWRRVRPGASTLPRATTCGWRRDCSRVGFDADGYSRIDRGAEYGVRADVTRRAAAVRPRGGGPRNLAPPARTIWTRHGCVARAGLRSSSARSSIIRSICCRCRETTTENESETTNTKKHEHEDEDGGRVVDSEQLVAATWRRVAPDREDEQRHRAQRTQRTRVLLGQLAAAHQLQHEREKRRAD